MKEKHIPGRLQISTKCDQMCPFCSVPDLPIQTQKPDELKKRIRELKNLGTTDLFITGGEPSLYEDLLNILDYASRLNFKEITIQSNAANLDKNLLEKIKKFSNIRFNISFHASDKETFKELSGSDHYDKVLKNIRNICDLKIPIFFTIVINKLNYKKLKKHINYIKKKFPEITHFSFNFIDPTGRAIENKWIVPTLAETQRYIHETVEYIKKNNMTFRLERVPLCYMRGFEEFSTESRRSILDEKRLTYFAQQEVPYEKGLNIEKESKYTKNPSCEVCFLDAVCPGLNPNYEKIYGTNELFPVFTKPEKIIKRIRKIKEKITNTPYTFKETIKKDLILFKKAITNKPNKNNLYDTYSFFLMNNIGFRDKNYIYKMWEKFTKKIRKGEEPNLLSFYIHFPYCKSPCDYCIYPSTELKEKNQINDYIDFLIKEMKLFSPIFKGLKFKTLSIGGGTPSLMDKEALERLISNIYNYFQFENEGEKSIEFNPFTTTKTKLETLDKFGFNKLSIGVQSLSKQVLKEIKREYQTIEKVREVISEFKKTKIGYINVDLLLGLKNDTPKEFLYTFEEICKMKPNLICVYPIKTNEEYIDKRYSNLQEFLDFYYPLFDEVTKEIPKLAKKYGYKTFEDPSKLSYVHPFDASLEEQPERKIKFVYSNFKIEQYSNFSLGYYSESCINNEIRYIYVNKEFPSTMFLKNFSTEKERFTYMVNKFLPNYSKVKFITHSIYEDFNISRKEYKKRFGKDITEEFPYAIKALTYIKKISIEENKIQFNISTEKEVYEYLLFFVGRENIKLN